MKYLLYILFCCLPFISQAQTITTIAGGGTDLNEGVSATSADIGLIKGAACDRNGNVYIGCATQNKIRKVDSSGLMYTIAGTGTAGFSGDGGQATAAELNHPVWIALDKYDNIYFSDNLNNRIRKIDKATGVISTFAGNGNCSFSGDSGLAVNASLCMPHGLAFDTANNLYFADNINSRIRKVDQSGVIRTVAGDGQLGFGGDGGLATNASFDGSIGLCLNTAGDLYIADGNNRIRKVDHVTNNISTIAGNGTDTYNGDNIQAANAQLHPWSLMFNSKGQLFVSDHNNQRIRMIDTSGVIHTIAGSGNMGFSGDNNTATQASFYFPEGLAFDHCDNLYIADNQNSRIRKVTFHPDCFPLNITDARPLTFTLHPNPATSQINITSNTQLKAINIFNTLGQQVMNISAADKKVTLDIGTLPAGVYYVKVTDQHGAIHSEKIIKEYCDNCNPSLQLLMEEPE